MPIRKLTFKIGPADAGKRLDHYLAEVLPSALKLDLSRAKIRKLIVAGAVQLNYRPWRIATKILSLDVRIDAFIDVTKLTQDATSHDRAFTMSKDQILFEDDYLIAINKPAGLPTQPTLDEKRDNLFTSLKDFLARRDKVNDPYLGIHHRLDRDTSGIILLSKKTAVNAGLADAFANHRIEKIYQALTIRSSTQPLVTEWHIENYLNRDRNTSGKQARYRSVKQGGDFAQTDFRVLSELAQALWLEARPRTGRTHQIRVHLSEYGLPILGDPVYHNDRSTAINNTFQIPRLMLHAISLAFTHPITKRAIKIESPLPADFQHCLTALKK